jgi:hypothetical protein
MTPIAQRHASTPIFHIRRQLKKARGNQFYRNKSCRFNGTYCGGEPTSYDIGWKDKAEPFNDITPCAECIRMRGVERNCL